MKKNLIPPPHRVVNGKKLFKLECRVDCEFRQNPQQTPPAQPQNEGGAKPDKETPEGSANNEAGTGGQVREPPVQVNGDLIRVPDRVLSAVDTWSDTWFGPQLVRNGHNNAYALRKMAGFIDNRRRPVPVMWDHTNRMKEKAGKLENGRWEDSKDIPSGVNADIVINRKFDARAAMGLETGEINATSVSWAPDFEMSHPDMDFELFVRSQGREVDGTVVCWLPVDLDEDGVIHLALVWAGADPFSGPREEQTGIENAASAAQHTQPEGGRGMEEKLINLVLAICNALGVNVALMAGKDIPDWLEKSVTDKVGALNGIQGQFNDLAQKLQTVGNSLLKEGETSLTATQVLERLPERIEMAKHGEAFLASQQKEALAWFDKAHVDPGNPQNMSDVQKRNRERLSNCSDLQLLADTIAENRAIAEKRFGPIVNMRSSQGEEIPGGNVENASAEVRRAAAAAETWRSGGKR
jgi:hypothetical protein